MEKLNKGMALVSFLAILALWQVSSGTLFNPLLVPTPLVVARTAWEMLKSLELLGHIAVSVRRIVIGYAIGCGAGIAIGVLMGRLRAVRDLLDPPLEFIRSISPVALVPLAIIWFGIGELSRYFIILYASLIVVILNTAAGVAATPLIRIRAAQCLGAPPHKIFLRIILPSAWPYILTGLRVALGFSFMGVVAAEMIAADSGIGFLIMQSRLMIQTERMFVGLVTLGLVGALTDRAFRVTINRLMSRYMLYTTRA